MKRTLLLLWITMATLCVSAQFKATVTAGTAEVGSEYSMSFNLTTVCKGVGADYEELSHILEVWLDANRKWKYPNGFDASSARLASWLVQVSVSDASLDEVIGFLRPCKSATLRSHYPSPKAVPTSLCPSSTQAPELGYTLGRAWVELG